MEPRTLPLHAVNLHCVLCNEKPTSQLLTCIFSGKAEASGTSEKKTVIICRHVSNAKTLFLHTKSFCLHYATYSKFYGSLMSILIHVPITS